MNAREQLSAYLDDYRSRLKTVLKLWGAAVLSSVFLVVSLAAAYLAVRSGFADQIVWYGRLALAVVLGLGAFLLILLPLKRLQSRFEANVERLTPEFGGRIQTLGSVKVENPMQELLVEDALQIADRNAVAEQIPNWKIYLPTALTGIFVVVFLTCLVAAPGLMNYSLRHLIAGWAADDLLPPQTIVALPGDELIRRGSSLLIRADASGYQPSQANLFVKMESGDWQQVSMSRLPAEEVATESIVAGSPQNAERSFDFTLFSVREPLTYYVEAMGIRSPNYQVDVIDLPGIRNLKVTYNYPEWTGLAPETLEQGGDIDALPGTQIALEITTDSPLPAGELVLNGETLDMDILGETGSAEFLVDADGEYFLAARIGAEQVRLSDNYFIRALDDESPDIEFSRPGRDRNATSIEEVFASVEVEDDYRLENVELRYAINGGDWQTISLPTDERSAILEHVFYLEEMRSPALEEAPLFGEGQDLLEQQEVLAIPEMSALVPGDLISYYALAEDRNSRAQTDIFFIEVQPFDRRVSQAEQGGGGAGMGAGQGASEQEISQRQREIVISTWNLIREQAENASDSDVDDGENRVRDNALLLSNLQRSLQEQAQSLLETAQSRRIDGDQRVSTFIDHVEKAISAMTPASERLAEISLEAAMQSEQVALQHLLRADAVFNDIQLSLNQGGAGGGGGGGGATQDLAEMMELEIDFEQNQYETGSQASRESLEQQTDDALRELEDLARRQQQLADNLDRMRQQPSEAQQWQQEMLRREAEALQERLEQLERNTQQAQSGQPGQSGQSGQTSSAATEGQAGEPSQTGDDETEDSLAQNETARRLESALEAMERAAEAMRSGDTEQMQQAAGEAQRQLEGAGSQIAEEQEADLQRSFEDLARRARDLHGDQTRMEETLLDGVQQAIASAPSGATSVVNPFDWQEEQEFADEKREMIAELQWIKEGMLVNADRVRADNPSVARMIDQADRELKDSEIAIRMDIAANYMSRGESLYVANSESIVTRGLDELRETLEEAARALAGGRGEESTMDRLLGDLQRGSEALREASSPSGSEQTDESTGAEGAQSQEGQQAGAGGTAGENESSGSEQASGQGQQQGGQQGGQRGADAQAGNQAGGNARWNGWGGGFGGEIGDAETQLNEIRAGLGNLVPELRARGMDENQISEINDLVRDLQNASLNADITNRLELNRTLALLEQLQQSVEEGLNADSSRVRSESPVDIQIEYQEAVAEYYRRLSNDENNGQELR